MKETNVSEYVEGAPFQILDRSDLRGMQSARAELVAAVEAGEVATCGRCGRPFTLSAARRARAVEGSGWRHAGTHPQSDCRNPSGRKPRPTP